MPDSTENAGVRTGDDDDDDDDDADGDESDAAAESVIEDDRL